MATARSLQRFWIVSQNTGAGGRLLCRDSNTSSSGIRQQNVLLSLQSNLPPAPVFWLTIQKHYSDLAVATYGRGIYILDDISPLRDWDKAQQSAVYFFKPRQAYRYRVVENSVEDDVASHVVGANPPAGADLNYYLQNRRRR